MSTLKVDGNVVSSDDPCALYQALYAYKVKALSGGQVEEVEIRSPITNRRTRFSPADMPRLEAEIDLLKAACEVRNGAPRPTTVYFNMSKGL